MLSGKKVNVFNWVEFMDCACADNGHVRNHADPPQPDRIEGTERPPGRAEASAPILPLTPRTSASCGGAPCQRRIIRLGDRHRVRRGFRGSGPAMRRYEGDGGAAPGRLHSMRGSPKPIAEAAGRRFRRLRIPSQACAAAAPAAPRRRRCPRSARRRPESGRRGARRRR